MPRTPDQTRRDVYAPRIRIVGETEMHGSHRVFRGGDGSRDGPSAAVGVLVDGKIQALLQAPAAVQWGR